MTTDIKKADETNDRSQELTGTKARTYRVLRLRPCTKSEIVTVTGFSSSFVDEAIAELLAAGLLVKIRYDRFFSTTNAIWRYGRRQRRYLIGIIIGGVLVALGLNEFASFLLFWGIVLLGVFVSLFT